MKKAVATVPAFLVLLVIAVIATDRFSMRKFNQTKLQTDRKEFERDWGKPDKRHFNPGGETVLIYKTILGFTEYVFIFDSHDRLDVKYAGD